jgi:hypothetical protein
VARPEGDYARSVQRVVRLCASAYDARELRLAVLNELRRVIDFDAYVWLLTDPLTWVGTAPLADVPCLPELPMLIRLKYQTTINRWTTLPSGQARTLQQATADNPSRSLPWREFLHRYGVHDVASVGFADRFGCWGFLDLWRPVATPGFDDAEAEFLGQLTGPMTAALRRTQAGIFRPVAHGQPQSSGPVVLLLSPDLRVRAQTAQTQDYLRRLVPPEGNQAPVPAGAYNVAAQLLAIERDHRDDHASGPGRPVRPGPRSQFQGRRIAPPADRRRRHARGGTADVPVPAHRARSPEGHLHQDRHPQPPGPGQPRRGIGAVTLTRPNGATRRNRRRRLRDIT